MHDVIFTPKLKTPDFKERKKNIVGTLHSCQSLLNKTGSSTFFFYVYIYSFCETHAH